MTELAGLRVLVVEDENMVALLVEDMLEGLGCEIMGSAGSVAAALRLLTDLTPDFALLDVNLAGERVFPVAAALAERKVPFAFATGYGIGGLPEEFRDRPAIGKPFQLQQLVDVVSLAVGQ
jgi:CheY-like chemotaxis protein